MNAASSGKYAKYMDLYTKNNCACRCITEQKCHGQLTNVILHACTPLTCISCLSLKVDELSASSLKVGQIPVMPLTLL
jgi:hypothetical protein